MKITIKKLDRWMKREGVQSVELANYLGVSKSAISKWRKRGNVPVRLNPILEMILSSDRRFLQRKPSRRTLELF